MQSRSKPSNRKSNSAVTIPLFTVEARLKRTLRRHLHLLGFTRDKSGLLVPPDTTKDGIRRLHALQRTERVTQSRSLIEGRLPELRKHFANGSDIVPGEIRPRLELVESDTDESDLFRLASLTWSVPVSQGYGRRMRFLVWDDSNDKLIGLFALGDPVFNLRVRDQLIDWTQDMRRERLVNVMDAFVLGAVPPYNMLLGGKLIASLIRSIEVKDLFAERYRYSEGVISGKVKKPNLTLVTTSSSLGRSSIYNRLKLGGINYFENVGYTQGWGHFHIPDALFGELRAYLRRKRHNYAGNHQFGQGPNWKLRALRESLKLLGENADLLCHQINREVFLCTLAANAFRILRGEATRPNYKNLLSVASIAELAKERWIHPRAERMPEFKKWRRKQIDGLLLPHLNESTESDKATMRTGQRSARM